MTKPRRANTIGEIPVRFEGPTSERIAKSQGDFVVGDDKQGGRVYTFLDSPVDRLYGRLVRRAGTRDMQDLQREYTALKKYRTHWHHAGLEPSLPSVDLGRTYASDPSNFSGMAKTERQHDHRMKYRDAVRCLGMMRSRLIELFVCEDYSLEDTGRKVFSLQSPYRARCQAELGVRESAQLIASFWGVS